jgi:hypothetical protein
MNTRRIFVFSEQAPTGRDLAGLLGSEGRLDAVGWETDLEQAIRRIQKIHPPAVIIADQNEAADCGPSVARILAECPGIQIAAVNLETGAMRIYGKQQIVEELKALVSAVARRAGEDSSPGQ